MERLTERTRNHDGTAVSKESLVIEHGMRKGTPSAYCCAIVTKLAEFEDAEEQGLLLRLPCKVGDTIWDIDFGKPCSYEVTGFSYGSLNEDDYEEEEKLSDEVIVYYKNWNGSITGNFPVSEIGKTVFLTRAEAEQALKQMGE